MMPWTALKVAGVLGINRRNLEFILPKNPRRAYPNVDDKLITKRLCLEADIPVPSLLAQAASPFDLKHMAPLLDGQPCFVMKPARGAMGNGTLVIRSVEHTKDGVFFVRSGGKRLTPAELWYHGSGIIAGLYSLGGRHDRVMVEELLTTHPELARLSTDGVPDIRIILYRGVPVMSMVRLPTRKALGRANLHQGAVGAGIQLHDGRTHHAVCQNEPISTHPDNGEPLIGQPIPQFARALEIAMRAADQSGLGYVGADVVVDAEKGPVILELNARPGLSIQIANRAGLAPRLEAVDRYLGAPAAQARPEALGVDERLDLGRRIAGPPG